MIWYQAVLAEWLRRLTRNQMGSARVGSNPANCEIFSPYELEVSLFWLIRLNFLLDGLSLSFTFNTGVDQRPLYCSAGAPSSRTTLRQLTRIILISK